MFISRNRLLNLEEDIERLQERTKILAVEIREIADLTERNRRSYWTNISQLAEATGYVYRHPEETKGCYVPRSKE